MNFTKLPLMGMYLGRDGDMYVFLDGACAQEIFVKIGDGWDCFIQ